MISLNLTNAGRSAFISTNALSIEHFLCGDLFNQSGQSMETQTPFQFDIAFQQVYIKGQEYDKNGVTVTEDYDHIKIVGYLSPADITFSEEGEYTVREIALIGSINQQEVVLAYGYDEEGIKLIEDDNTQYTIKLDIICEATPNIQNSNANGNVTYRDFDDHINKKISNEEVHGLKIVNGRIYINNAPLVIDVEGVSNAKMDNIVGINSEVEVLPTPSSMPVGFIVALKDTGAMYKNIEITENNAPAQAWQPMNNLNSQIQLLANQMWFPLWQTNTSYSIGDPVKTANCKPFEYLECIASGITGDGISLTGSLTVGEAYVDGTCVWLCCDIRDGRQPGEFYITPFVNDKPNNSYIEIDGTNPKILIYISYVDPIENDINFKYLRLFRKILNQALYQHQSNSLFDFTVSASNNTTTVNPVLLHGAGVVIMNQWCNLEPFGFTTIQDITLQDYIDINTYNTMNSTSFTESQFKSTAQTFLDDILNNNGGVIAIRLSPIKNRYLKLLNSTQYTSRLEEAGLPNIKGSFKMSEPGATSWGRFTDTSGVFTADINGTTKSAGNSSVSGSTRLNFDASKSNAIYGNGSTVRPDTLIMNAYIKF